LEKSGSIAMPLNLSTPYGVVKSSILWHSVYN
jgi:hypothetical protein